MKKKVCFFSGDITRGGGTERVSIMIANGLAGQGRYEILFLSLIEQSDHLFFELDKRIEHYSLGKKWINPGPGYLKVIPKLRHFLKEQKVDIIIDIDIVLDILSLPAANGLETKVVSWEHFNYGYEMKSWYRRYILKYSIKRTDYVITLTEGDKKTYMKNLGRKKNISAIYNPVQEMDYGDVIEKEKWLITVGRLILRKGMDYLAETAVPVLEKYPDWKWLVVGDGEEREFLEQVIERHHLQGRLVLAGRTDDVNSYLKKAQIYVMTSRVEGLPMCLLEAKTFCLPSVSFDIPTGPGEIIQDKVNGYLIKAFDCQEMVEKLEKLMEDGRLREQFSRHAQDNLSKFQMETILENWNQILEGLL